MFNSPTIVKLIQKVPMRTKDSVLRYPRAQRDTVSHGTALAQRLVCQPIAHTFVT